MLKKSYTYFLTFSIIAIFFLLAANLSKAQETGNKSKWKYPLGKVIEKTDYRPETEPALIVKVAEIINLFLSLLGIILVIFIFYAGYLWLTAAGNDDQIAKSKQIIRNAVIGLGIILSAYSIANYIIDSSKKSVIEESSANINNNTP